MADVLAVALKSFYLGAEVKTRRKPPFPLDQRKFNELKARGLVKLHIPDGDSAFDDEDANQNPNSGPGEPQSALPAAQASPQTTASQSGVGEQPKRGRKAKTAN